MAELSYSFFRLQLIFKIQNKIEVYTKCINEISIYYTKYIFFYFIKL